MHVKFEEYNAFVKNVVEIDSLGEDMERITMKDSPINKKNQMLMNKVKFKRLKWSQYNYFQRIEDMLQITPKTSSYGLFGCRNFVIHKS